MDLVIVDLTLQQFSDRVSHKVYAASRGTKIILIVLSTGVLKLFPEIVIAKYRNQIYGENKAP